MLRHCHRLLAPSCKTQRPLCHPLTLPSHFRLRHNLASGWFTTRAISTSSIPRNEQKQSAAPASASQPPKPPYVGPLEKTFRRLKIFSVSSFALSATLAPFMFIVESSLPMSARFALASIALGTSGLSTALVGWCGQPYVTALRYLKPEENAGAEGIEMVTQTLTLKPRITKVYDPTFLIETKRGFAKWELAETLILSKEKTTQPETEETIAETSDSSGMILGRWVVKWNENGEGICHEVGEMTRYFNVHEELL